MKETKPQKTPSLSLVLPTYNERENIAVLIPDLARTFADIPHEILVVDDSSTDGTGELVLKLSKTIPGLRLITREKKAGIGAALRDGYNQAQNEIILSSDADSFSPADIRRIYDTLAGREHDIVVGSRHIGRPNSNQLSYTLGTTIKWEISRFSNRLLGLIFRIPLSGFSVNCRAIRRHTWRAVETKENGNFFLFEMLFAAHKAGARIGETPVTYIERKFGESKVNRTYLREAIKALGKIIRLRLRG